MNNWRNGNSIGTMYILDESDLSRVGDCWMKGRLHTGDVVLCTAHSGDCFNDYVLIRPFRNGLEAILGATFGAYVFGTQLDWQPSAREYHLLLAGEMVINSINEHPLSVELSRRRTLRAGRPATRKTALSMLEYWVNAIAARKISRR